MNRQSDQETVPEDQVLHYHLMHPGGESAPGDPNAAFYLDGVYHLHYIFRHPWRGGHSFSFAHVTSPDMLHWTWQPTQLQPAFTGHGMFSGTGFLTKEGRPAIIYHGQGSGRNHIVLAQDRQLSAWERPYPVEPRTADGQEAAIHHWDPDCFLIGESYYAISGGQNPPLLRSEDLKHWVLVGDFLRHEPPDVVVGEDISCGNFFPLGEKWMLLCISHPLGCRYYLGEWDEKAQQFVPQRHGRMNWRRSEQRIHPPAYVDFFAPESVQTPDGRRVMWAWLAGINEEIGRRTIQSLPRELSLAPDGNLLIRPLRELESLRHDPIALDEIVVSSRQPGGGDLGQPLLELEEEAMEVRIVIDREEALRRRFGLEISTGEPGDALPIFLCPETARIHVGTAEAPFAVADLPEGEDLSLRLFLDRYLVEVFAGDRQALVAAQRNVPSPRTLRAYAFGGPLRIRKVEAWKLHSCNQGLWEARQNRVWECATE